MDELLSEFLAETTDNLETIDAELIRFEENPQDKETLNNIFRIIHTLKGTCGFLELPRLEAIAHAGETLLGRFRDGVLEVTPEAVSVILECVDAIKGIKVQLEQDGIEPKGDDSKLIASLSNCANNNSVPEEPPEIVSAQPVSGSENSDIETRKGAAYQDMRTIRVRLETLEQLMNIVSELVLTRNQLLQMVSNDEESEFKAPLQNLSAITAELQETVMKTRMQPIGSVWSKMPRLVRDAARELNKSIALEMQGEQTELDRQVLEQVKDPLTHMIRNACDHGIETPEMRSLAGKSERGTIRLSARLQGGHMLIDISDDGRGLDAKMIRTKAVEKNLASPGDLEKMSDNQVRKLIFTPGFSTVSQVTNMSGRGVGMDVVKTNIEGLRGNIDLYSEPGKGTRFTIKIPLTMTIISALIVGICGERLALPQLAVLELIRLGTRKDCRLEKINDATLLRLRNSLLPIVYLAELLGIAGKDSSKDEGFAIIMHVGSVKLALIVEEIFDTEEIVVKPLAEVLGSRSEYYGATILGDGRVILILDPNGIMQAGLQQKDEHVQIGNEADKSRSRRESTDILLFSFGEGGQKACPLGLVTRLEVFPISKIERSMSGLVTQYCGHLIPLAGLDGANNIANGRKSVPVIVFGSGEQAAGLIVDKILDIIEEPLDIELESARPGILGTAVLSGKATEIMDIAWYLEKVRPGWTSIPSHKASKRILLLESHPFFRSLLYPLLSASGYDVALAESKEAACAMIEDGIEFDLVLADIDKVMDQNELSEIARDCGAAQLAMSERKNESETIVLKSDRNALLENLQKAIGAMAEVA